MTVKKVVYQNALTAAIDALTACYKNPTCSEGKAEKALKLIAEMLSQPETGEIKAFFEERPDLAQFVQVKRGKNWVPVLES